MRKNPILDSRNHHTPVINGWLAVPNSFSALTMARQGWDSLTIDMQHGSVDYQRAAEMIIAMSVTSVAPMVRVPWLDQAMIMKMLDAGACGIICPMINTAEQARQFVDAAHYPPMGIRSFGPIQALLTNGDNYAQEANDNIVTLAMIETKEAIDNLDEIIEVDGLTGIYIGPADLSLALGCTPKFDQTEAPVVEAIDSILARCKEKGVFAGIHNGTPEYAKQMIDKGFNLVTIGSDARLMASGSQAALNIVRSK